MSTVCSARLFGQGSGRHADAFPVGEAVAVIDPDLGCRKGVS